MKIIELVKKLEELREKCWRTDGNNNPDVSICVKDCQGYSVIDIDKVVLDEDFSKEEYINIYCEIK